MQQQKSRSFFYWRRLLERLRLLFRPKPEPEDPIRLSHRSLASSPAWAERISSGRTG
jgi:hypothetical protein